MDRPRRITARLSAGSTVTCPLCRTDIADEAIPSEACSACSTRYHVDCARELGGCSTQGCSRKGEAPLPAVAGEREQRRRQLIVDHEERLARFRAGRDARVHAQRRVDLGAGLQLAGLIGFGLAALSLSMGKVDLGSLLFVLAIGSSFVGRMIHTE